VRARPALTAIFLAAMAVSGPSVAEEQSGKVQEIIIKIDTPDGPRWYSLGADLSKIDVRKGAVVRFNYLDDTIDSIEVEEVPPGEAPAAAE
jgi:hypothetical protein